MIDHYGLIPVLGDFLRPGQWCTGYQASASINDEVVLDVAVGVDGSGQEVAPDDLFAVYCAGKPYLAVLIATLVDAGELSFEDRLCDVLERPVSPSVGSVTIWHLLSHRSGLNDLSAVPYRLLTPADRNARLVQLDLDPASIGRPQYTEFVGWQLLQLAVEDLMGERFPDLLQEHVLVPWGVDAHFNLGEASADVHTRVRLNVALGRKRPAPILWERSMSNLRDVRAADGCYVSMRELRGFYAASLKARDKRIRGQQAALSRMTEPVGINTPHTLLGRSASFGLGFMTRLSDHLFGDRFSERSYGHSGLGGMTFAGADPDCGLAYAVHANGVTEWASTGGMDKRPELRRQAIGNALMSAFSD